MNFSEPVVDDRDAVRSVETIPSSTPTTCSRSTRGRSAARSSGIVCGSLRRAVTRRSATPRTLAQTGVQVVQHDTNKRGEIKLTGTVAPDHTLQGGYMNNPRTTTNSSGVPSLIIDPNALSTISTPNRYYHGNYRGVLGNSLLIEAQLSGRHNELIGGGTGTNLATDSPFVAHLLLLPSTTRRTSTAIDAEQRNNRQFTGSVTDFWNGGGSHETKGGYEWYRSQRTGGGSQSPTQYVFVADFADRRRRRSGPRRDRTADSGFHARVFRASTTSRRSPARC